MGLNDSIIQIYMGFDARKSLRVSEKVIPKAACLATDDVKKMKFHL